MQKVVIVQEYVPSYRVAFFNALHSKAETRGIEVIVAHGYAHKKQAQRGDTAGLDFALSVAQREWKVFGKRLVIRRVKDAIEGADLVILEQARRNVDAYFLLSPLRRTKQRIALWGHGRDYTKTSKALDRFLLRQLLSRAHWFFAYTGGGVEYVVANGYPEKRTTVVQNSIDTDSLREQVLAVSDDSKNEFSSRFDLKGKTALFIGALEESKRLEFLVEASRLVHQMQPDYRLLIVGDGELRRQVEDWAVKLPFVSYLGSLSGKEKALALASSQVMAMPGRIGLIAVDSFASSVPIVTTAWEWHAPEFEYLEHGRNSVISDNTEVAFAEALEKVLRDARLRKNLEQKARIDSEHFTLDTMVNNYLHGIENALLAPSN